jgi:hypothetical protein
LADDQAEITRLLEAVNGHGPAEFFKRTVLNEATSWVARTIRFGASIGLEPDVSTPIIFETLNEIRAMVAVRAERESLEEPRE